MSDNTPKEDVKAIPQELADDIAALAADIGAMSSRAARGWKITAVVWVILLSVIAGYLYLLVYAPLKELLEPESIVQMGFTAIDGALQGLDPTMPSITEQRQFQEWASSKVEQTAPTLMSERVKPRLEELLKRIPEERVKWTARFREEGPVWINDGVNHFGEEVLPEAQKALLDFVDGKVDELLAQFGDQFDAVVLEVVDKTEAIMQDADLKGDSAALHGRLEAAFEEAMGPVLDELLADLDLKVRNAGLAIKELVKKYNAGNLTQQELLEVRLIQLTLALFEGALDEAPAESGLMEQLRGVLEQAGVPLVDQEDIIEKARTATPANMDEILSKLPEQDREAARKALTEQARQAP